MSIRLGRPYTTIERTIHFLGLRIAFRFEQSVSHTPCGPCFATRSVLGACHFIGPSPRRPASRWLCGIDVEVGTQAAIQG